MENTDILNPSPRRLFPASRERSPKQKLLSLISAVFQFYSSNPVKKKFRRNRNFQGAFEFTSRSTGANKLLLVVAGHKPGLWPLIFPRIHRFLPCGWDVCLCVPGVHSPELARQAQLFNWSILKTEANQLAIAQNLAIREHPSASFIVKIDEDIFLTAGCLDGLEKAFSQCAETTPFVPGIVAPLINVNGFSSRIILEKLWRLEEFEKRFGCCRQSCTDTPVWQSPEAAKFLWEITMPLDETAARFLNSTPTFIPCPLRFSIGCLAIQRAFWEEMDGFTAAPPGSLGVEEIDLIAHCAVVSRPIMVARHLLVGHAGFGPQMQIMEPWLLAQKNLRLDDPI